MNDIRSERDIRPDGAEPRHRKPRVAVVVPNPCNPDYRVIKQAEFLAKQGYEVRIFCTRAKDVPNFEVFNGVTYRRIEWHVGNGLRRLLGLGPGDPFAATRKRRAELMRKYLPLFENREDQP